MTSHRPPGFLGGQNNPPQDQPKQPETKRTAAECLNALADFVALTEQEIDKMTPEEVHEECVAAGIDVDSMVARVKKMVADAKAKAFPAPLPQAPSPAPSLAFDFRAHLQRQREFSERTFGPGSRAKGVVDHIRKELLEIEAEPEDLTEWIDVAILALDGAWRAGYSPEQIIAALVAKQDKNEARQWPDWRTQQPDKAITHLKPTDYPDIDSSTGGDDSPPAPSLADAVMLEFEKLGRSGPWVWPSDQRTLDCLSRVRALIEQREAEHVKERARLIEVADIGKWESKALAAERERLVAAMEEARLSFNEVGGERKHWHDKAIDNCIAIVRGDGKWGGP